jgi:NAD(P)-dependent dehydrogenase (short-subunit alcohol dehydrogenase family)
MSGDRSAISPTARPSAGVLSLNQRVAITIGQPDDVASVITFHISDDARWITGDTIAVSAVRSFQRPMPSMSAWGS